MIGWKEIERCDVSKLRRAFNLPLDRLRELQGQVHFAIEGCPKCPEQLCEDARVRKFFQRAARKWGGWLYICNLDGNVLRVIMSCMLNRMSVVRTESREEFRVTTDWDTMIDCFMQLMEPAAQFYADAGFTVKEGVGRLKAAAIHVGLADDPTVPPE